MLYCINKKTVRFYDEKAIKNDSINKRSPICLQSTKLLEKNSTKYRLKSQCEIRRTKWWTWWKFQSPKTSPVEISLINLPVAMGQLCQRSKWTIENRLHVARVTAYVLNNTLTRTLIFSRICLAWYTRAPILQVRNGAVPGNFSPSTICTNFTIANLPTSFAILNPCILYGVGNVWWIWTNKFWKSIVQ